MIKNRYHATPPISGRKLVPRRRSPTISNETVLGIGLIAASALGLLSLPWWWQLLATGGF